MSGVEQFDLIEENQSGDPACPPHQDYLDDIEITSDGDDMIDETPDVDQEITEGVEDGVEDSVDQEITEGSEDMIDDTPDEEITEESKFSNGRMHMEHLNETQQGIVEDAIAQSQNPLFHGLLLHLPTGSGKTRTGLVLGLNRYDQFLVIASKTLIPNWVDELKRVFGHNFQYEILHRDYLGASFDNWSPSPRSRIIFTTPEVVLRSYKENGVEDHFVELHMLPKKTYYYNLPQNRPFMGRSPDICGPGLLHCISWSGVFIDEVQCYTNALTGTCRAIASLYCKHRWLLSASPVTEPKSERLLGFFLLLNFPRPNSIPELNGWLKSGTYHGIKEYAISCPPPTIPAQLHMKEQVYNMSPSEIQIFAFFKEIVVQWFEYYQTAKANLPPKSPALNKIRGHLLALLTYTRISLVSPKKAVESLVDKINTEPFLQGLSEALEELKPMIEEATDHSSRLQLLYDILTENSEEQCIVFSSFVVTLEEARKYIAKQPHLKPRTYYVLSSQLSTTQRATVLTQFREDPRGVLFMTYGLGGQGLNLQTTNVVVMLDLFWNVELEKQAVARAFRMGQTRDVYQHYLISNLQYEHSILSKQIGKTRLVSEFIEGAEFINPRLKAGAISYRDMVSMIKREDVQLLLDSKERFVPKPESDSVLSSEAAQSRVDNDSAVGAADWDDDISDGIPSIIGTDIGVLESIA